MRTPVPSQVGCVVILSVTAVLTVVVPSPREQDTVASGHAYPFQLKTAEAEF